MEEFLNTLPKSKLFKLLFNHIDGFFIFDDMGRYSFVSQKWKDLTGYDNSVIGHLVTEYMPGSPVPKVIESKKELKNCITTLKDKYDNEFLTICSYIPLFSNNKFIGGFVIIVLKHSKNIIEFSDKITNLFDQINFYEAELSNLQQIRYSIDNISGHSEQTNQLKATIRQVAKSSSTVLIQGESGTGKELVAQSLHVLSTRSSQPLVKVNCAAIPPNLLESELFGYAKGAFTGANKTGKKGKFVLANKGTLFLDEIHHLPYSLQPKLLRALQENEIQMVGSESTIKVDCRIIVSANESLFQMVKEKRFREDLFYRLNVINIDVPPLRNRKEDIPDLANTLLKRLNRQLGMSVPGISNDAINYLKQYDWPGNIRELENVIERAMNLSWFDTLQIEHFKDYFKYRNISSTSYKKNNNISLDIKTFNLKELKEKTEKEAIKDALIITEQNKTEAAKLLGITRAMLYRKIEKYKLG